MRLTILTIPMLLSRCSCHCVTSQAPSLATGNAGVYSGPQLPASDERPNYCTSTTSSLTSHPTVTGSTSDVDSYLYKGEIQAAEAVTQIGSLLSAHIPPLDTVHTSKLSTKLISSYRGKKSMEAALSTFASFFNHSLHNTTDVATVAGLGTIACAQWPANKTCSLMDSADLGPTAVALISSTHYPVLYKSGPLATMVSQISLMSEGVEWLSVPSDAGVTQGPVTAKDLK